MTEINVSFEKFLEDSKADQVYQDQIVYYEINNQTEIDISHQELLVHLDAYSIMLVNKGEITVTVDYMPHVMTQYSMMELTHGNLLNSFHISNDATGHFLVLSKDLMRELLPLFHTIPQEYVMNKTLFPTTKLEKDDFIRLTTRVLRLRDSIGRKDHFFHRKIIVHEVAILLMEVLNIGIKNYIDTKNVRKLNLNDELAVKFFHLLLANGKHWNEVNEYANELCVSPTHLSRCVKAATGRTVMDWINEIRLSEAKLLLRRPNLSLLQIATDLNFSDQSSFGKFFKKFMGMSPLEYRRSVL